MLLLYENVLQPDKVSCSKGQSIGLPQAFETLHGPHHEVFFDEFEKAIQLYSKECYNSLE